MTDNTQPEALRLADAIKASGQFTNLHTLDEASAELLRQHARIAELEAELEAVGAGGVQALSAAPAGWKLVPVEPTDEMLSATYAGQHCSDVYRDMLAASPTPPAEQQAITPETGNYVSAQGAAITSESGAVYAELPELTSTEINDACWAFVEAMPHNLPGPIWNDLKPAVYAAICKFLQAAPKAAPGELVNGWPVEAKIYKRHDEWVLELSGAINDCAFTCRHTQPGYLQPEDVAGLPSLYSDGPAPQQEAQEPTEISEAIERMAADRYKVVPSHESMFHRWAVVATGTQQLYLGREVECQNMARKFAGAFLDGAFVAMQQAAPQQEPAPLSDDTALLDGLARLNWYVGPGDFYCDEAGGMNDYDDKNSGPEELRQAIRAALAAQGGKV